MDSKENHGSESKNLRTSSKSTTKNMDKEKSSFSWKKVKSALSLVKKDATPPNWQMIFLSFVGLYGAAYSITFIFPFLPDMVLYFGYEEEEKGYYSGLVATAMFAGRIFSSYFWGWLSDKIGRKPIIMLNLILVAVTNIAFGFSTNLLMAIVFRFINGLVNGIVGCIKSILYEVSDNTNQAIGMASISFGWGLGVVTGPLISGFTASPATKYPKVFGGVTFFEKYPFFLPGIIAALIQVLACVIIWWKLPETLEKKQNPIEMTVSLEDEETKEMVDKNISSLRKQNPTNSTSLTDLRERSNLKRVPHSDKSFSVSMDDIDFIDSGRNLDDHNKIYGLGILMTSMGDLVYSNPSLQRSRTEINKVNQNEKAEQDMSEKPKDEVDEKKSKRLCDKIDLFRLLRQKDSSLTVALYSIFSFGVIGFDELVTVWASTKEDLGGLGFTSDKIGSALGMSALGLIFLQVILFPKAEAKFGAKKTYEYFCYFLIFSCAALPAVRCLDNYTALWVLLLITLGTQKICMTTCFSGTALMINNSVHPSEAGKINGIAMTLAALARTLAPVVGGSLFSWSMSHGYKIGFPFDVNLAFILFSFMFYVSNILCAYVPSHLNKQAHR